MTTTAQRAEAKHPFGELLRQYRQRKPGLSQGRLAELAGYDQSILVRMSQGKKDLTGPSGRERVVRLMEVLAEQGALTTLDEANALLLAAALPPLFERQPAEAKLMTRLAQTQTGHRVRRTNLPAPLTRFVGRAHEVAEVRRLLRTTRLLTLIGAGGAGKTRLAQQAAADELIAFPNGVWYAELATLSDGVLIADAVVRALGLVRSDKPAQEQLTDFLSDRHVLLVLDNCEHLIADVAAFALHVLRACPRASVLATSREALNVDGEQVWRVPPMQVDEAAELFVARAGAARSDVAISQHDPTVAHICQRLDGMPLAIELAAARLHVFGLSDVAARLDQRFSLLTSGRRGALPRHQTLRALMDWSHDLLTEPEQVLLRRLGVFVGGWAIAEAEAAASDERLPRAEVLPLLSQLVAKSLVQMDEQDGEARYRLLETVREYALEKLSEHGEVEAMRCRHAEAMLAIARDVGGIHAFGRVWKARSAQLRHNLDNFRAVFAWSASPVGDAVLGLELLVQFWRFWGLGLALECARWTKQLLDVANLRAPVALRANALLLLGMYTDDYTITKWAVARAQDLVAQNDVPADNTLEVYMLSMSARMAADQTTTRALLEKSVAMSQSAENVNSQFFSKYCLAGFLGPRVARLDIQRSQSLYEEMIALGIQHEDEEWMAAAQVELAYIAIYQMEFAVAHNRATQALRLSQSMQAHLDEIGAIQLLAELDQLAGNLAEAIAHIQNASTLATEFGLRDAQSTSLALQVKVESDQGDHKKALSTFAELVQYGPEYYVCHALGLEGLVCSAGMQNQLERVAILCGAAEGLRARHANLRWPKDDWLLAPHLERARTALGEEAYAAAYAEGRAMRLEQAIEFALSKS